MSKPEVREYRYERKFLVDQLDAHQVRALIKRHPGMFYEPYPPRYVNNLYLDNEEMENYHDNVAGVAERRKVRIRWYGDLFGDIHKPLLEFKIKSGLVGTKAIYPFTPFALDERFCHPVYLEALQQADLPGRVKQTLRGLHVVLCNRYYRWYFATRDRQFRVTIDSEMSFYQVRRSSNRFVHRVADHQHIVVELKYDKPLDVEGERIAGSFPFSVTRNSKYVTGIELVYH